MIHVPTTLILLTASVFDRFFMMIAKAEGYYWNLQKTTTPLHRIGPFPKFTFDQKFTFDCFEILISNILKISCHVMTSKNNCSHIQ